MPPTAVALGFTLWQLEYRPRAQYQHEPQKMLNGTITRAPTCRLCTARAAEDVERDHPPVADLQALHRGADLLDDADELVAERVADPGVRHQTVVEVQVGAADCGQGDPDDRVVGMLDAGHRLLLDPQLVRAAVHHRLHRSPPN